MGLEGLEWQTVEVRFTQGLDTRTDQKLVVPGKWLQLNNLTLSSNDALTRRDGMAALVSTANGNGLALYNSELLVINGSTVSSVATATTPAQVTTLSGKLGFVGVSKSEVKRSLGLQDSCDCAYGGGFTCYVWINRDATGAALGIGLSLVDETTGTHILNDVAVSASAGAFSPRVVYAGGLFLVIWLDGNLMNAVTVNTTGTPAVSATTALINSANLAGRSFDMAVGSNSGRVLVAYGWADGITSVRSILVGATAPPTILAGPNNLISQAQLAIANLWGIAVARFGTSTAMGVFTSGVGATAMSGLAGVATDASGVLATGPTQLDATIAATGSPVHVTACNAATGTNALQVFYDRQSEWGTNTINPLKTLTTDSTLIPSVAAATFINSAAFSGSATTPAGPQGPWIAGKAFNDGTGVFLPVCIMEGYSGLGANTANNNQQNTIFVLNGSALVAAKALYGSFGPPNMTVGRPAVATPCSTPAVPSGWGLAVTERTLLSFSGGVNVSPTGICRLTFSPNYTVAPLRAQLGTATYIAGGSLSTYDGASIVEHGFPLFPEGISVVRSAAVGGNTAGVHQVVAIYEWIDGAGQRHQSAPSTPVSFTSLGADTATAICPTLLLSQKSGIGIVFYMTQAGGLTLYRVNSLSATLLNVTTANSVTLTINISDATLGANEVLYTQPNQAGTTLPNNAPGPCNVLALHQNRLWVDVADTPNAFRYSQQLTTNVGLQFNETLGGLIDVNAGGIVGFTELDEKIIIFAARRIYAVLGSGPTSSGGYSNYSDPTEIQSDVGCVEARSILKMPNGIIFKAKKGWHLLGRDMAVRYIGEGVKAYDSNDVTSAVLLDDRKECRFSSTGGRTLVFSYLTEPGQWSTFTVSGTAYAVRDAVWWPTLATYCHVSKTEGLNKDTIGTYTDAPGARAATQIVATWQTAFLHLPQLEGFQRVRRMYLTSTPTNASASLDTSLAVAVDFDDTFAATSPPGSLGAYNFTAALSNPTQTPTGSTVDIRHNLHRQKCKSVAFTFTDTPTVTSGNGINPTALALEIGVKRSVNRLPAAQVVG